MSKFLLLTLVLQKSCLVWDHQTSVTIAVNQKYFHFFFWSSYRSMFYSSSGPTVAYCPVPYKNLTNRAVYSTELIDAYNKFFFHYSYLLNSLVSLNYFKSWSLLTLPLWFKLTFRGKGFRVRKFNKGRKITFNFGRSHWTRLYFDDRLVYIFKVRRQNYIFITVNTYAYAFLRLKIKIVKPINMYTKRGLRLKKQRIQKRFGKISQMISSLHF